MDDALMGAMTDTMHDEPMVGNYTWDFMQVIYHVFLPMITWEFQEVFS